MAPAKAPAKAASSSGVSRITIVPSKAEQKEERKKIKAAEREANDAKIREEAAIHAADAMRAAKIKQRANGNSTSDEDL